MIKQYIKKPVIMDVLEYTGDNFKELQVWFPNHVEQYEDKSVGILTPLGRVKVSAGSYIMKDPDNNFYPCDKETLDKDYTPLEIRYEVK